MADSAQSGIVGVDIDSLECHVEFGVGKWRSF